MLTMYEMLWGRVILENTFLKMIFVSFLFCETLIFRTSSSSYCEKFNL